ncbi:Clathrin assembly protein AP180 [Handroanthus impetiginosus]|uniref:Clathrin assembly protein AP180 n=1 Tax=Handroanthus impetiginosus TaxID=429701 RepID=A0A2G9HPH8_9LAMI|nr:Clathrin assembly protein AP180 [Handroanthus impetiginosus]
MRLWRRASGIFKDQNSIWLANLSRRTALRNPDIEKAVIRATTHYDLYFDRRNIERVCEWLRISPFNLKPILWSVSNRMEKTRNWVVALKGLYLMHNVTNSRVPCVRKIGRLPFDLSNFNDGYGRQSKTWPFNTFIRAYYAFLDQKSTVVFQQTEEKGEGFLMKQELVLLQKLQALIDLLMQIKPQAKATFVPLILDVMDGIIIEIYDLYSRICRGIAIVLMNIYSANKAEATMALSVVQKATQQGEDLSYYFEFCQEIGVVNASEFPVIDRIPEEGLHELEQIIKSFSEDEPKQHEEKAIVLREAKKSINEGKSFYRDDLRTIITDKWEKFDEDLVQKNPFESPLTTYNQELPDLISF